MIDGSFALNGIDAISFFHLQKSFLKEKKKKYVNVTH